MSSVALTGAPTVMPFLPSLTSLVTRGLGRTRASSLLVRDPSTG